MSDPKATTALAYATSGGAMFFGFTANEVAALVGAFCAVLTFLTNFYFQARRVRVLEASVRNGAAPKEQDAD